MVHVIWGSILFFSLWGAFVAGLAWEYMHWSRKWDKRMAKLEIDSNEREEDLDKLLFALKVVKENCTNPVIHNGGSLLIKSEKDLGDYIDIGGEG